MAGSRRVLTRLTFRMRRSCWKSWEGSLRTRGVMQNAQHRFITRTDGARLLCFLAPSLRHLCYDSAPRADPLLPEHTPRSTLPSHATHRIMAREPVHPCCGLRPHVTTEDSTHVARRCSVSVSCEGLHARRVRNVDGTRRRAHCRRPGPRHPVC